MFTLITINFSGVELIQTAPISKDRIKPIYESYIKRCLYGFPDIAEIRIVNENGETVTSFFNWRR